MARRSLVGSIGFTVMQEGLFRHAGFKYAGLVTFSTQAVFTTIAFIEIRLRYDMPTMMSRTNRAKSTHLLGL